MPLIPRRFLLIVILGMLAFPAAGPAFGQGADAALRDRVNQLVERLGSGDAQRIEEAAKSLIDLGPRVLPLLPDPASIAGTEQAKQLADVRQALDEVAAKVDLGPSLVTLQGDGIRLSEVLRSLQQQSGNRITDLREQYGQETANPALDLQIEKRPFFEALDLVCKEAGLVPNFYTGDGSVGLMVGNDPAMTPPGAQADDAGTPDAKLVYPGPFRVPLQQFASRRDFVRGAAEASARMELAWEPRLRPMLLTVAAEDIIIVDDRGEAVPPSVMMESENVVLRPENPVAEINLNMNAPDRAASSLRKLAVKSTVTLPGGVRGFRFSDLTQPSKQTDGDLSVQLVSTQVEDFVWKVRVILQYPGEGPAFESYQQGLFNNQLWLQKDDGTRFEHNGGFSNLGAGGGRLAFEYLFVDVPGQPSDWGLVYETPSSVESIPLEFEFEDVPLP